MDQIDINSALLKIELVWESLVKEKSEDMDAYRYIVDQSMSLKLITFKLKDSIENQMLKDKRARIKLHKLHKALANILKALDSKNRRDNDKDHIERILTKLLHLQEDIEVIRQYQ